MQYQNYLGPLTQKKAAVLRYKPPGFSYSIDIPFPGRVLPVCARCKKNYKTREHCRSKEGHTGLPWTDTYICITLDASCITPDGKLAEGPFVATGLSAQPYVYASGKILDPKTPSCAMCKDKNYTRTYCRASKKHKTLPWSTVYVMLSARDGPHAAAAVAVQEPVTKKAKVEDASADKVGKDDTYLGLVGGDKDKKEDDTKSDDKEKDEASESKDKKEGSEDADEATEDKASSEKKETPKEESKEDSEKKEDSNIFGDIHISRTFLSTVSVNKNEAEWVELDQNQANYLSHRQKQDANAANDAAADAGFPAANPYGMLGNMANMGTMGINMAGFPANYGPGFPGAMGGAPPAANKDGTNPANGMERSPVDNQWMNGAHPGMPGHPTPYTDMMSQMMDPRMAGYGFHPGWHGRGYPTPMDMSQMHNPYGAQPNPYQQYPPMAAGQYPMDMSQGMPPQAMAPGMPPQGMQQQANFSPQAYPPQGAAGQPNVAQGQTSMPKDDTPPANNTTAEDNDAKNGGTESAVDDNKTNGDSDEKKEEKSPQKEEEADV